MAIVILRFARGRAIEESEWAIALGAHSQEDDAEVDETAGDAVNAKMRTKFRNLEKFSSYKKIHFRSFRAVLDNLAHYLKSLCWDYICTIQLPGVERINGH